MQVSSYALDNEPLDPLDPHQVHAPPCVRHSLEYVTEAAKEFVCEPDEASFNEVLTVAYM